MLDVKTSTLTLLSGSERIGASNVAWYADLVLVPKAALKFRDSAPPKIFLSFIFVYADPSTFPTSVPVCPKNMPFSFARM